jgi:hypothetical protein
MRTLLTRSAAVLVIGAALALASAAPAAADIITPTEGQSVTAQLGTFTEDCPTDPETHDYDCGNLRPSAQVNWGDGTSSAGTLTRQEVGGKLCIGNYPSCTFDVSGTHTYAEYGTYSGTVSWGDPGNPDGVHTGSFTFTADVADAPIALSGGSVQRTGNSATLTATLTDANPDGGPCSFDVEIDWNDGSNSNPLPGDVEQCQLQSPDRSHLRDASDDPSVATFTVTGTHTYSSSGEPSQGYASVLVTDDDGGQEASENASVPIPPNTSTSAPTSVSQTSATLNGEVDAQGGTIEDCEFEWGSTASYGNTVPCGSIAPDGTTSATLSGLQPDGIYHFQIVLTTNVGTSDGGDQSFTTLSNVAAGAPTVITGVAGGDESTSTTAVLGGQVNPNGGTLTDCRFEYGTTTGYASSVPCSTTPSGSALVPVAANVSGLSPDTTYHFRLVATNSGAPESDGADATFTTLPLCNITAKFGYVDASGCLSHQGSAWVSTEGSTVSLDGLTVTPQTPFISVTLDSATGQITSTGYVTITAGLVNIYEGRLGWTEPDPDDANSVTIASLDPPFGTEVAGIRLDGEMSLDFNKQDGADMTGNATLPFGSLASVLGANGQIVLHTAPGVGLETDQLQITASGFQLLGVGVKNLKVSYDPGADTWSGGAEVTLPTPNKLDIAATLAFQHGSFQKFSGSVGGLNFPIFSGVDLQKISVVFGVDPTTIGGGLHRHQRLAHPGVVQDRKRLFRVLHLRPDQVRRSVLGRLAEFERAQSAEPARVHLDRARRGARRVRLRYRRAGERGAELHRPDDRRERAGVRQGDRRVRQAERVRLHLESRRRLHVVEWSARPDGLGLLGGAVRDAAGRAGDRCGGDAPDPDPSRPFVARAEGLHEPAARDPVGTAGRAGQRADLERQAVHEARLHGAPGPGKQDHLDRDRARRRPLAARPRGGRVGDRRDP